MFNATITRRSLAAGAALALALGLGGCATINSLFGGPSAERDADTGEIAEEGTGSAFEVEVGDCFDIPAADEFSDLVMIPCSNPHEAEAYLNFDVVLDGDVFDEDAVYAAAEEQCSAAFREYVGSDPETSKFTFNYFTPIAAGWEEGDRVVNCIAFELDLDSQELVKITGSIKGAGE